MINDIFGNPNEGIHSYRFLGMASVDLLFTFLGSILIAKIFKLSITTTFIWLFCIGQILHYSFNVKTSFIKFISY